MVYFDVKTNCINAKPMWNHQNSQMIQAYQKLWARTNHGQKDKAKHAHLGQ
jgi:hypothetical protein